MKEKENKNCTLVRDLLPSYIDGMCSKETNELVLNHLQECHKCEEAYESMVKDFGFKEDDNNKKKIKVFKKINRKIRTLQLIIFIIVIILLGIFIKKLLILNKIETMAKNIDYNNYYERIVETTDKISNRIECYQNGNNFFILQTKINNLNNEILKSIRYRYNGDEHEYIEVNGQKSINEVEKNIEPLIQYQFLNKDAFSNVGLALTPGSLRDITLYKKDCYLLKVDNYLNFIDKKTGLTIKEINIDNNSVIDYVYSFGSVNDEKILELIEQYK